MNDSIIYAALNELDKASHHAPSRESLSYVDTVRERLSFQLQLPFEWRVKSLLAAVKGDKLVDHVIKTGLDVETQKTTLDKAFDEQVKKYPQYNPAFKWEGETLGAFSFRPTPSLLVAGKLHVTEGQIGIEFTALPLLAKMFKGKAIELVEKEVQIWVEKAKAGS